MNINLTKFPRLANIKAVVCRYIEGAKLAIKSPRTLDISIGLVFVLFVGLLANSVWSAHLKNYGLMKKLEFIQGSKLETEKKMELLEVETKAANDPIYVERVLKEQRKIPQGELLIIDNND